MSEFDFLQKNEVYRKLGKMKTMLSDISSRSSRTRLLEVAERLKSERSARRKGGHRSFSMQGLDSSNRSFFVQTAD